MRTTTGHYLLALIGCAGLLPGIAGAAALEAPAESSEGYYQLRWEADEPIRLVEATSAGFADARTIYTGSDTAHVVSGKPDGVFHYRIETAGGGTVLADPVVVTVRHHSLSRAFSFFALGAVVFLATLGLILFARSAADERTQ